MASRTANEKDTQTASTRQSRRDKLLYAGPEVTQAPSDHWLEGLREQASGGNPTAQFMVGHALENGVAGSPDPLGALEWYRKAALQAARNYSAVS